MPTTEQSGMAKSRALITDTEFDRISGEADVDDSKKYQAVSRVRKRIRDELPHDIGMLEENHPALLDELRDVVCEDHGANADLTKIDYIIAPTVPEEEEFDTCQYCGSDLGEKHAVVHQGSEAGDVTGWRIACMDCHEEFDYVGRGEDGEGE